MRFSLFERLVVEATDRSCPTAWFPKFGLLPKHYCFGSGLRTALFRCVARPVLPEPGLLVLVGGESEVHVRRGCLLHQPALTVETATRNRGWLLSSVTRPLNPHITVYSLSRNRLQMVLNAATSPSLRLPPVLAVAPHGCGTVCRQNRILRRSLAGPSARCWYLLFLRARRFPRCRHGWLSPSVKPQTRRSSC